MITFGSPPAFKFDAETKTLIIKVAKPDNDRPVIDDIVSQLKHVKHANVCLSGGVDSQFALRVAQQLNVPITLYTYVTLWNDTPINSDDVLQAEIIAEKNSLPLEKVYIDLHDFFNTGKHLEYANKYKTSSPQIAVHLYFIEKTFKDKEGTLFLGGEVPIMSMNSAQNEGPEDIAGLSAGFFIGNTVSYRLLCDKLNIDLVKDIPLYTPEIIYKVLKHSISVVKEKQIHAERREELTGINMYAQKLKYEIYESILPGGINPLVKRTGFEKLKKYYATSTGIYNQFDLLYRTPIEAQAQQRAKNLETEVGDVNIGAIGSVKYKAGNVPHELTAEFRDAINKYNSKSILEYYYDF